MCWELIRVCSDDNVAMLVHECVELGAMALLMQLIGNVLHLPVVPLHPEPSIMGLSPNARVELLRRNRLEDVQVRLRGDDAQLVGVAEGGDGGQAVGVAKHDALAVLEEAAHGGEVLQPHRVVFQLPHHAKLRVGQRLGGRVSPDGALRGPHARRVDARGDGVALRSARGPDVVPYPHLARVSHAVRKLNAAPVPQTFPQAGGV
mmetsp:Transcript_30646/g.59094  ORF Transcript_30646/g.59094 Transcript_30646/m.59094 type:complete len:204 (+) Transcript_30646:468-1079(+)